MEQPVDIWADDAGSAIRWSDFLAIAVRRRRLIAFVFALGTAVSAALALRPVPTYRAVARLMVSDDRTRFMISPDAGSSSVVDLVTAQDLNAEVAMLSSTNTIRDVLERHRDAVKPVPPPSWTQLLADVLTHPTDWPARLYSSYHEITPVTPFEGWVRNTAGHTGAYVIKGTNLIEVAYEAEDPQWAAQFVNELLAHHVERHATLYQQEEAREFIGSQRELLSATLRAAEGALRSFAQREDTESVPDQRTAIRAQMSELQAALESANRDLVEGQARASFLERAVNSQAKQFESDSPRQLVRARLLELQLQRTQLLAQFAPTSIRVHDLDGQIAEAERLLKSDELAQSIPTSPTYQTLFTEMTQTRALLAAVTARIAALQSQIGEKAGRLAHLDDIAAEYDRLEQDVTSAREGLLTYRRKEEQARFSVALDESRIVNVTIVERAEVPLAPTPSPATTEFLFGVVISLALAAILAYVRDRVDPSVKSGAEAGRMVGLPVLADIPP
jgi:uncharacterized protein involved in exopolysaccharide biosynthesis